MRAASPCWGWVLGARCWVLGAGCWVLGAGAGAGALFGSFWGPGVLIWSPFWPIWGPFGCQFRVLRKRLPAAVKTSKTAPLSSGLPVLPKRFPPSVLAVRGDWLVFPYPKYSTNTQITTYSEQRRRKLVWLKGQTAREGCCF